MMTTAPIRAKPRDIPTPRPIPRDMTFGEFERIEDEPEAIVGAEKKWLVLLKGLDRSSTLGAKYD
jgi:hypothetical protein